MMKRGLPTLCGVSRSTALAGPAACLDAVDLEVSRRGVGLLGANGAGKTTLMKVLLGLTSASDGAVEVRGRDPRRPGRRARSATCRVTGFDYPSGDATLRCSPPGRRRRGCGAGSGLLELVAR
jgi:ABC-type multidrug transport system ATPase subunit